MAGSANSIVARNVLRGRLSEDNLIAGGVGTAFNPAYALVDEAGNQIVLYINSSNYQFYAELKDKSGNHISNSNIIDLPLESMVVNGSYDATTKEVVLVLNNGNEVRFSVADLVEGLVSTEQLNSILTGYVKFTDYATTSKTGVIRASSAYGTSVGPSDGIMSANVKAYNDYPSSSNNMFISKGTLENVIAGKNLETANNKVTSVSPSSTDTQYPTAKLFYNTQKAQDDEIEELQEDAFGDAETTDSGDLVVLENTLEGALDIELGGKTSQEAIAPVAGTEVINTSIGVTDVDNTKENHIILKGNTSQESTTGKNLLPVPTKINEITRTSQTLNGITFTPSNIGGEYTISGTASAQTDFTIFRSGAENLTINSDKCSISAENIPSGLTIILSGTSDNGIPYTALTSSNTSATNLSITDKTKPISYLLFRIASGTTINTTIHLQLEKGSSATNWEEYTGGIASPNPDYPQDIQVVSGNNNIEICGKNLANINNIANYSGSSFKRTVANDTITIWDNTNTSGYSTTERTLSQICPGLQVGDNVTLSFNTTTTTSNPKNAIYLVGENILWYINGAKTITQKMLDSTVVLYGGYQETAVISNFMIKKTNVGDTTYQTYSGNNYSVNLPVENLFDGELELGNFSNEDGSKVNASDIYRSKNMTSVKPNTTYTLSIDGIRQRYVMFYYNSSGTFISTDSSLYTGTFTTPNNCYKINFRCFAADYTSSYATLNVQMEKGPKANRYTPYGTTPIELCKISDNYQDKIFKSNNEWYLHKETKKIILDGTETGWTAWKDSSEKYNYYKNYADLAKNFTNLYCISNYFTFNSSQVSVNAIGQFSAGGELTSKNGNILFKPFDDETSQIDNWKTWLSTHNTIVYYPLETPINTKITDTTLISQLNALYTAQLKNGITNISTEANDLLPYIDLKYNMTIASPSPEKPSDIHVVTGDNTVTVCGKNLSPINYKTISGTTSSSSTIGGFGGSVLVKNIPIEKNTKYFITGDKPTEVNSLSIFFYNGEMNATIHNGAYTEIVTGGRGVQTYPIPTGNDNTNYEYMAISAGNYSTYPASTAVTITFSNIMIRKEGTSEDYEPYQSQTYPINLGSTELCKLGSYQDKIIKPTGKNLFDLSAFVTKNNVSMNTNEVLTATSVAGTAWGYSNRNWSGTLPAGIYTLTMFASQVDTSADASIRVYNSGGNELLNFGYLNNIKNKSMILNLAEETTIGVMFKMSARGIWTFQIEKGSMATEYEPCSISNWFFKKAIYKVTFNGSESWVIATRLDNTTHYFNLNNEFPMPAITTSQITTGEVCNKFTMQNPYTNVGNNFWIFQNGGTAIARMGFDNETITSSADFKTWLSNNNVICYYPLDCVAYTKITDTTLIGQLDAIVNARSYKEFTDISQVNTDLPFELVATAFIDTAQGREAELKESKQDKLTPGANIKIENNVISAYDIVRTNGADHIYGNKTFEYYPTTNATTPTSNNQLINKGWVDTQLSDKVDISKIVNAISTTAGEAYDVRYINTQIGDIETLLETLDTGSGV